MGLSKFVLYVFTALHGAASVAVVADSEVRDRLCGPRCVQFLCRSLNGVDIPLTLLAEEMRFSKAGRGGVSLLEMQSALERRHLYSSPVAMRAVNIQEMSSPSIVAFQLNDGQKDLSLHFAVMLPFSIQDHEIFIWDGYAGLQSLTREVLRQRPVIGVLFTSPDRKTLDAQVQSYRMQSATLSKLSMLLCFQVLLVGCLCLRYKAGRSLFLRRVNIYESSS